MKKFENFTKHYKEFRFRPYESFDFDTNQKILILNAYNAIKKNDKLFPYMEKELTFENETISLNVDDNIAIKNDVEKNGIKFVFINTNKYFRKY